MDDNAVSITYLNEKNQAFVAGTRQELVDVEVVQWNIGRQLTDLPNLSFPDGRDSLMAHLIIGGFSLIAGVVFVIMLVMGTAQFRFDFDKGLNFYATAIFFILPCSIVLNKIGVTFLKRVYVIQRECLPRNLNQQYKALLHQGKLIIGTVKEVKIHSSEPHFEIVFSWIDEHNQPLTHSYFYLTERVDPYSQIYILQLEELSIVL